MSRGRTRAAERTIEPCESRNATRSSPKSLTRIGSQFAPGSSQARANGCQKRRSKLPMGVRELALEAPGYGLLVTCVGLGAIGGSFALVRLRRRWPTNTLLIAAIVTFFAMLLVLAWVRWVPLVCGLLALGGAAWTTSNQNFQ